MTPRALIESLAKRGVHLFVDGQRLRCVTLGDALTDSEIATLRDRKVELLAEVQARPFSDAEARAIVAETVSAAATCHRVGHFNALAFRTFDIEAGSAIAAKDLRRLLVAAEAYLSAVAKPVGKTLLAY